MISPTVKKKLPLILARRFRREFLFSMADQFVVKFHNGENISRAVAQLLQPKPMRRRNNYLSRRSYNYSPAAIA